jgi:hypothetical protein
MYDVSTVFLAGKPSIYGHIQSYTVYIYVYIVLANPAFFNGKFCTEGLHRRWLHSLSTCTIFILRCETECLRKVKTGKGKILRAGKH